MSEAGRRARGGRTRGSGGRTRGSVGRAVELGREDGWSEVLRRERPARRASLDAEGWRRREGGALMVAARAEAAAGSHERRGRV